MLTVYWFAKYNHNCTPKKNATIAATHAKKNLGKNIKASLLRLKALMAAAKQRK